MVPESRRKPAPSITINFEGIDIFPSPSARNLGVTFDSNLSMKKHVSSICNNAHSHFRQIHCMKKYLTPYALETLIHAFILSRLDFSNSLLYRVPDYLLPDFNRSRIVQPVFWQERTKSSHHACPHSATPTSSNISHTIQTLNTHAQVCLWISSFIFLLMLELPECRSSHADSA